MRPYLRAANVTWSGIDLSNVFEMNFDAADTEKFALAPGDVLLNEGSGSATEVGKPAIWRGEIPDCCFQNTLLRVRPKACSSEYLERYFFYCARSRRFVPDTRGVNIFHIGKAGLSRFPIPVPPLAEQRRIVAKLDRLSARSRAAHDHLARVAALAARARQAILAAAFSGELTAEWRQKAGLADEPRVSLSELRLNDSERGEWTSNQIPSTWKWRQFTEVFSDLTDSTRKLPQKEYAEAGLFPVVDQGAALIGGFTDDERLVHTAKPPVVVFGDHTRCVKYIAEHFVQGADGIKVLAPTNTIGPRLGYWLLSAIQLPDKGYSRHMKFLRSSAFPIPSAEEQNEIVRRIESAFARIDRLTAEAARAAHLLDRLDERLLAKAFRGELVPQDPADEPAEALLARLREAHTAAPAKRRGRRPKDAA